MVEPEKVDERERVLVPVVLWVVDDENEDESERLVVVDVDSVPLTVNVVEGDPWERVVVIGMDTVDVLSSEAVVETLAVSVAGILIESDPDAVDVVDSDRDCVSEVLWVVEAEMVDESETVVVVDVDSVLLIEDVKEGVS